MYGFALQAVAAFGRGRATATAGTVIRVVVPGDPHAYTYLTYFRYTADGTAHTVTMMRGMSWAYATASVAATGDEIPVDAALQDGAGNALAADDVVLVEITNNTTGAKSWHLSLVDTNGWDAGSNTVTLATAIPAGHRVEFGAKVISYGIPADAGHSAYTILTTDGGGGSDVFPGVANSGPLCKSRAKNEPIILSSDNTSDAGVIEEVSAIYAQR